jgi:hypothetical protein
MNVNLPEIPRRRTYTDKNVHEFLSKQQSSINSIDIKKQYDSAYSKMDEAKDMIRKRLESLKYQKENLVSFREEDPGSPYFSQFARNPYNPPNPFMNPYGMKNQMNHPMMNPMNNPMMMNPMNNPMMNPMNNPMMMNPMNNPMMNPMNNYQSLNQGKRVELISC